MQNQVSWYIYETLNCYAIFSFLLLDSLQGKESLLVNMLWFTCRVSEKIIIDEQTLLNSKMKLYTQDFYQLGSSKHSDNENFWRILF